MYNTPKVVICDSGLSENLLKKAHSIDIGCGINDENGHGSALTEIILKYGMSPDVTSIKILDRNCQTTLEFLYNALEKCTKINADIICLALSLDSEANIPELHDVIEYLHKQGKIIVSSLHNRAERSYPAIYSEVIGVRNTCFHDEEYPFFNIYSDIQCSFSAKPVIYGSLNENYSWITGSSLATGILVSHISSLFTTQGKYSFDNLCKILSTQSTDDITMLSEQSARLNSLHDSNTEDFRQLSEQLQDYGFKDNKPLYDQTNDLNIIIYVIKQFLTNRQLAQKSAPICTDDLRSFSALYHYMTKEEENEKV